MKNLYIIIKNNSSALIIILGLIVFLYFGYQIVNPMLNSYVEEHSYTDVFNILENYFK